VPTGPPRWDGHDDREGCNLSPEGPGLKAVRSNMCDTRFLKHLQASSNIVKYVGKTNPIIWVKDYRLACMVGGADEDVFIIQFLYIYLADPAKAWLGHLPRNMIDSWEDLREIFTHNFWS
jgi:hypothetical protein